MASGVLNMQTNLGNQRAQQSTLELERAQLEQRGYVYTTEMLGSLVKMPAAWRKHYIDRYAETYGRIHGEPLDKGFVDALKKSSEEELLGLQGVMRMIGQMMPGIQLDEFVKMDKNPDLALRFAERYGDLQAQQKVMEDIAIARKALQALGQGEPPLSGQATPSGAQPTSSQMPEVSIPQRQVQAVVAAEAQRQGLDPALALATASVESNFNPTAVSNKGAMGTMQVMPGTAQDEGFRPNEMLSYPQNAEAGVSYLKKQLVATNGNVYEALRRYNAGPDGAARDPQAGADYARKVLQRLPQYAGGAGRSMGTSAVLGEDPAQLEAQIRQLEYVRNQLGRPEFAGNKAIQQQIPRIDAKLTALLGRYDRQQKRMAVPPQAGLDRAAIHLGLRNANDASPEVLAVLPDVERQLAAQDAAAKQEATEGKKAVPNPRQTGPGGQPVTMKLEELRAKPPEEQMEYAELDAAKRSYFTKTEAMFDLAVEIEKQLHNPLVQKYLGNIFSNPSIIIDRDLEAVQRGLPPEAVEVMSYMATIMSDWYHQQIGAAQTGTEFERLKPVKFDKNETAPQAINKVRAFAKSMAFMSNIERKAYEAERYRVPGSRLEIPAGWNIPVRPPGSPQPAAKPETPATAPQAAPEGLSEAGKSYWQKLKNLVK